MMAKNRVTNPDCTIDELADSIINELRDRLSRDPPDIQSAKVEVSRMLRDALPALWEWSSQESEIERLERKNVSLETVIDDLRTDLSRQQTQMARLRSDSS